jgi:hypothetical protein
MSHRGAVSRHRYGLLLVITAGLAPAVAVSTDLPPANAEHQSSYYTYDSDWAIVSAPPPPGPYQSVNIDPRVPGQEDVIPSFAGDFGAPPSGSEQTPGSFPGEPPAAGPSPAGTGPAAYPGRSSFDYEPPPGYYGSRGFGMRRSAPVQEYRSPYYGYPQPGRTPYGYAPSPWSNVPAPPVEDEVPPPPAYNQMAAPPTPGYRGRPAPDLGYRRGTGTQ